MKIFAIVTLFLIFFTVTSNDIEIEEIEDSTSGEEPEDEADDDVYHSLCDSCRKLSQLGAGLTSLILGIVQPKLYSACDLYPESNSTNESLSTKSVSACRANIDESIKGAILFMEDEDTDELCHVLQCGNKKLEDINRRIYRARTQGSQDMACLLCQLKIPEMLEVFYTQEVMVNLKNFVRPKYCPKLSDIKEVLKHIIFLKFLMQCEKNTNYIFPIFLDNLNNYLINDNEMCAILGACKRNFEEPPMRSFDEL